MGEDVSEYASIYGYSLSETELRMPIYEYPAYDYDVTENLLTNEIIVSGTSYDRKGQGPGGDEAIPEGRECAPVSK